MRDGYYTCFLLEEAIFRVETLLGGTLSLRAHNAQISEMYGIIKALNELTELGIPKIKVIV
ncbi:Mobile element protein [Candidatus Enterovibrio altilux]|uniref:Mobile element protein n=1 Tax=Candidatus Enterovibrio altilux TaxID=1927128 RepID=A0A291B9D9_9GAMM|nr:Mobile element protein [Candidatus Enterovibrio luxaltus]